MKTVILESFEDESTGEIGLGVLNMPRDDTTNAARDGLQIAHDLVEHVNGAGYIGTIDDELEALGAIWYVRGQHGELRRDGSDSAYSVEENIASDVTRMFRDYVGGQYCNISSEANNVSRAVLADDSLQEVLRHADKNFLGEFDDDEDKAFARREWQRHYRMHALRLMRVGYSKAKRKYERRGRFYANNLFWAIADAVNPCAKRVDFEGARYKLTYGARDGDVVAFCEEVYEE